MTTIHFASDIETQKTVYVVFEQDKGNSFVQFRSDYVMSAIRYLQQRSLLQQ